jgi:AraC-like DNA-binding protein
MPRCLALIVRDDVRGAVLRAAHGILDLEFCASASEFERTMGSSAIDGVLVDTAANASRALDIDRSAARLDAGVTGAVIAMITQVAAAPKRTPARVPGVVELDIARHDFPTRLKTFSLLALHRQRRAEMAHALSICFDASVRSAIRSAVEHGARPRAVRELAAGVSMPRKKLDRLLLRSRAWTARQFLTCGRLLEVARWLECSELPVVDISDALGFASPSSLRNIFRRYLGRTPLQVRHGGGVEGMFELLLERARNGK